MKKFTKALALSLMLILCVSVFAACTPKTADKMRERYEDEGYTVIKLDADALAQYGIDTEGAEVEWAIIAMKGLNYAAAIGFKNSADAKDSYKDLEETAGDSEDAYYFRSGKVIVLASSEDALKIAK